MIGRTLGSSYQILEKIGEGGMGQVFRARDTNLERDVAIKVLPERWAADPERLARFRREAQILASLNHPNIAQIYGVETAVGAAEPARATTTALVMELVQGPTLAEHIALGPLSVRDALGIARQIADALDAAHERGVIHRDLKPANVKVREDGTVKVLDFGLAKAVPSVASLSPAASASPTITSPAMTALGIVLGTAAYMSPEQARGRVVDKRTDIWAFGCILFETLTGRRPFVGDDVTEVLAAVVKSEPPWELLPPSVPPRLVQFLKRCLEKDAGHRLRDVGDARFELSEEAVATPVSFMLPPPRASRRRHIPWLAAVGVCASISAAAWWWPRPSPPGRQLVTRFSILLPDGQRFSGGGVRSLVVSPDGSVVVYAANRRLYRRALSDPEPQPIAGTDETPLLPVFASDARSLAYVAPDARGQNFVIRTIRAEGGTPLTIVDLKLGKEIGDWTPSDFTLAWNGDQILYTDPTGIWAVPANGGAARTLISMDPAVEVASSPQLLDDGRHVLFTLRRVGETGPGAFSVVVQAVGAKTRTVLVRAGRIGATCPSGHLTYLRDADLVAIRFDAQHLEVTGDPVVVASRVGEQFAASCTGTIAYPMAVVDGLRSPTWVDRHGREDPIAMPSQAASSLRLSPDGHRIALMSDNEIRVWTFEKRTMVRLSEGGGHWDAAWLPDGRRLLFSAGSSLLSMQILLTAFDGVGAATILTPSPAGGFPNAVSPDGKFLIFHRGGGELMLQPLEPPGPARPLFKGIGLNAAFSPDGRWIAYQSADSGKTEVAVRAFPNTDAGRWQVSSGGGRYPLWSPDGRELFFVNSAGVLTAVTVDSRNGFATGQPVELFPTRAYVAESNSRPFDISPDGKHFVFMKLTSEAKPTINVVTNSFDEVAAAAPRSRSGPQ